MAAEATDACHNDPNFAVICSFLSRYGDLLGVTDISFLDLQKWLEESNSVNLHLKELIIKLLRRTGKSVSTDKWERYLVKFCHTFSEIDAWEVERVGYARVTRETKLRILKMLLETQFDCNQKFKEKINAKSAAELRCLPLGRDKNGLAYWYLLDSELNVRVFREDMDDIDAETWETVVKSREDLVDLINKLEENKPDNKDGSEVDSVITTSDDKSESPVTVSKEDPELLVEKIKKNTETSEEKSDGEFKNSEEKPMIENDSKPSETDSVKVECVKDEPETGKVKEETLKVTESTVKIKEETVKVKEEAVKNKHETVNDKEKTITVREEETVKVEEESIHDKVDCVKDKAEVVKVKKEITDDNEESAKVKEVTVNETVKNEEKTVKDTVESVEDKADSVKVKNEKDENNVNDEKEIESENKKRNQISENGESKKIDEENVKCESRENVSEDADGASKNCLPAKNTKTTEEIEEKDEKEDTTKKSLDNRKDTTPYMNEENVSKEKPNETRIKTGLDEVKTGSKSSESTEDKEQAGLESLNEETVDKDEKTERLKHKRKRLSGSEVNADEEEDEPVSKKPEEDISSKKTEAEDSSRKRKRGVITQEMNKSDEEEHSDSESDIISEDESESSFDPDAPPSKKKRGKTLTKKASSSKSRPHLTSSSESDQEKRSRKGQRRLEKHQTSEEKDDEAPVAKRCPKKGPSKQSSESSNDDKENEDDEKKGDKSSKNKRVLETQTESTDNKEPTKKRGRKGGRMSKEDLAMIPVRRSSRSTKGVRTDVFDVSHYESKGKRRNKRLEREEEERKKKHEEKERRRILRETRRAEREKKLKKKKKRTRLMSDGEYVPGTESGKKKKRRRKTDSSADDSSDDDDEEEGEESEELRWSSSSEDLVEENEDEEEYRPHGRNAKRREKIVLKELEDNSSCSKCGKGDHPEWILLCDKCDAGYHNTCLRPILMLIPDGEWFCPPCEHAMLIEVLNKQLTELDVESRQNQRLVKRKERLAFVGISLDNILTQTMPRKRKPQSRSWKDDYDSEELSEDEEEDQAEESRSESESDFESGSSGEEDKWCFAQRSTRNRKQINYRFDDYEDAITEAIGEDVREKEQELEEKPKPEPRPKPPISRGKDMSTITGEEEFDCPPPVVRRRKSKGLTNLDVSESGDESDEYQASKDSAGSDVSYEKEASDSDWSGESTGYRRKNRRSTRRSHRRSGRGHHKSLGRKGREGYFVDDFVVSSEESDEYNPRSTRRSAKKGQRGRKYESESDDSLLAGRSRKQAKKKKSARYEEDSDFYPSDEGRRPRRKNRVDYRKVAKFSESEDDDDELPRKPKLKIVKSDSDYSAGEDEEDGRVVDEGEDSGEVPARVVKRPNRIDSDEEEEESEESEDEESEEEKSPAVKVNGHSNKKSETVGKSSENKVHKVGRNTDVKAVLHPSGSDGESGSGEELEGVEDLVAYVTS